MKDEKFTEKDENEKKEEVKENNNGEENPKVQIEEKDNQSPEKEKESEEDDLQAKFDQLSERYMRLAAEYDNFRKRSKKEKEEIYSDCIVSVTGAWLPVIDDLDRALFVSENYKNEEAKKIAQGVEMILEKAKSVMEALGVEEIEAFDKDFDPETMEAVMHIEDENAGDSQVVEVLKKGYIKGNKIIRHAVVKVAN